MKTHVSKALPAIILLALLPLHAVRAAPLAVPASLYPAGAHITYRAHISNQALDCMWGFFCEGGVPLFHLATQDQLGRLDGWGQVARWKQQGVTMTSELFVSRYAPRQDGKAPAADAYLDLLTALRSKGYGLLRPAPSLLPTEAQGASIAELEHTNQYALIVMACTAGSTEVEAIVMVDGGTAATRGLAVHDLVRQVRAAYTLSEPGGR